MSENTLNPAWLKLPFTDFELRDGQLTTWQTTAGVIIKHLTAKTNIGLIGETGSGKTIVAILSLLATSRRTLFLTPTRSLVTQHGNLYKAITGLTNYKQLTGQNANRDWTIDHGIVIATPQSFARDIIKNTAQVQLFDLLIIDECHLASGDYDYVAIAKTFSEHHIPILGLTASPGGNLETIDIIQRNCQLREWVTLDAKTFRNQQLIKIDLDDELLAGQALLKNMMQEALNHIRAALMPELDSINRIALADLTDQSNLQEKRLISLGQLITQHPNSSRYEALSAYGRYRKLSYSYRVLLGEHHLTFLDYVRKLKSDTSKAAAYIISSVAFRNYCNQIYQRANNDYPKLQQLISELNKLAAHEQRALIFVNNKTTIAQLLPILSSQFKITAMTGGAGKSTKREKKIIDELAKHELDFILTTSVWELGVSLPNIDAVIHYTPPNTEIAAIQRDGRTGRFQPGKTIYLMSNFDYEQVLYFSTQRKIKVMHDLLYPKPESETLPILKLSTKSKRQQLALCNQDSLF